MSTETLEVGQAIILDCKYCGDAPPKDEREQPYKDGSGDVICWECIRRLFTFDCCKCGNYEHEDNQHRYLVVNDAEEADLKRGVYRIIGKPYVYMSVLGGGDLCEHNLLRVGNLPRNLNMNGYPCGHLCRACSKYYERKPGKKTINPAKPWPFN